MSLEPVIFPPPNEPMAVARQLVASLPWGSLRHWRGDWMRWTGPHWSEDENPALRAWAWNELEEAVYAVEDKDGGIVFRKWQPSRVKIANVMEALQAVTYLTHQVSPPAWLIPSPFPPGELVACANGLLHVGTRELIDHTPEFFNQVSVPFGYDPGAPTPRRWLAFLDELWPDDPDAIMTLQDYFGYVLSGRTDLQKILLLIGPTRSGKGTIARVLTGLVGRGHVAGPTLASLGTNFGLQPLLGKPLAIVSDARLGGDASQVVERLLSISGEDTLTVDRKYRTQWTGPIPARFLIISNELPGFGDASGAIAARFIVLMMTRSWRHHENVKLTRELLTELPGILSWSLDELDRLTQRGYLTEPSSSADAVRALQDRVSPVSAFVRDRCQHGGEVEISDLFGAWREWCEETGHRPGSVQSFGVKVRAAIPVLKTITGRDGESRTRRYIGLSLNSAHIGEVRVPMRTYQPELSDLSPKVREGTRTQPMSRQLKVACPRHAGTRFGAHPKCGECLRLQDS